jgi:Arc/MetJ-type ribon-helix-helix transcriptional regulator
MSIILTPNQENIIEGAIRAGLVRSVDEFIETAVKALPQPEGTFDAAAAQLAVARIRELRKGVTLNRGAMSFREMAHIGHKY